MNKRTMLTALVFGGALEASALAQQTIPIEAYAQQPAMGQVQISPSGTAISFTRDLGNGTNLIVIDLKTREQKFAGCPKTTDFNTYSWVNDDYILLRCLQSFKNSTKAGRGNTTVSLSYEWRKGKFKQLFKPDTKKWGNNAFYMSSFVQRYVDLLPDEENYIAMSTRQGDQYYPNLYRVDIRNGKTKTIVGGKPGMSAWEFDSTGKPRMAYGYNDNREQKFWISDDGKSWDSNPNVNWIRLYNHIGFSEDPNYFYVGDRSSYGTRGLYKLNIQTGTVVGAMFENEEYDIDQYMIDPYTKELVGVSYIKHRAEWKYLTPLYKEVHSTIKSMIRGMTISIEDKARDKNLFIVSAASDRLPHVYFLYDHDTKELSQVGSLYKGFSPNNSAGTVPISFKARDELTIPGYLTLPLGSDGKNLPTVVWVHGGPQARDTNYWDPFVQFLANRGYAVLQINFRGSTGYGRSFAREGEQEWGGKMQEDVTDGTNWLIEQGIADKDNICIGGVSYGGYASAMGLILEPDLYKCGISINGAVDLVSLNEIDNRFKSPTMEAWHKHVGLRGAGLRDVSPRHQVEKLSAPILLISSYDDFRLPWEQSFDFHKDAVAAGKDSTFVRLDDGGHSLLTQSARAKAMREMEAFLEKHLK